MPFYKHLCIIRDECELAINIPDDDPVYGGVARDCLTFVRAQTTEDLDCNASECCSLVEL